MKLGVNEVFLFIAFKTILYSNNSRISFYFIFSKINKDKIALLVSLNNVLASILASIFLDNYVGINRGIFSGSYGDNKKNKK